MAGDVKGLPPGMTKFSGTPMSLGLQEGSDTRLADGLKLLGGADGLILVWFMRRTDDHV